VFPYLPNGLLPEPSPPVAHPHPEQNQEKSREDSFFDTLGMT
jgi:hypothetical protein